MARYQVPQFLEVEDKIFGPFTFKQFLYIGGGAGLGFICWKFLPTIVAIIIGGPLVLFFFALAFVKINERPFVFLVENAVSFVFSKKLYLWRKTPKEPARNLQEVKKEMATLEVPKLSESKLRSLSWELDVHESLQAPENGLPTSNQKLEGDFKY